MSVNEPRESAGQTQAPPTVRGPMPTPPPKAVWPTVIGVIAIVFGALATLQGCFGAVSLPFFGGLSAFAPAQQTPMFQAVDDLRPWLIVAALFAMALGILLLVAGVGLVQRRAACRNVFMVWAGLKIPLVVVNSIVAYLAQQAQFEAMQEMIAQDPNMPAAMPGMFTSMMQIFGAFVIVLGILWGWALPVFVLIWFSRDRIKHEVAGWAHQRTDVI